MEFKPKLWDPQVAALRDRILYMGGLAEHVVHHALRAALDTDAGLGEEVMASLEPEINRLQVEIDERVLALMRLHPPGEALRLLAAVLKMTGELERVGDLAVNIVELAAGLAASPSAGEAVDLPLLAGRATGMLRAALDAFMAGRAEWAHAVLTADDDVDRLCDAIARTLTGLMRREPSRLDRGLALLAIARHLERIADHATNIAEEVIFWIEGVDVRHHSQEAAT
jgi:phosphate transport system protein